MPMLIPLSWNWPADFPPDCPPPAATPAHGVYYRIVKTDPPGPADFVSQYHQNRRLVNRNIQRGRATQCETMGLSVFANPSDAAYYARVILGNGNRIARLTLPAYSGKILPTPRNGDSHHTWWPPEGYNPLGVAIVIANP